MEQVWLSGNFSDTPLPKLLYRIWNSKRTGCLVIKKGNTEKKINFSEGDIAVTPSFFENKKFLDFLQARNGIPSSDIKKCEEFAKSKNISPLKSLTELNITSSLKLWGILEIFLIDEMISLFDWPKAKFFFDPAPEIDKSDILISVSPMKVIRKGIYQMTNTDIINTHIPSSEKNIHTYSNKSFYSAELNQNESYVLNLIREKIKMSELYQVCEMGKKEINRLIYLFMCLRMAGPSPKTLDSITQQISQAELRNILESFNKKCTYIFKYISKEIGPVALSVLEKCIKESKTNLPPPLQNISLSQDGKINISSTPSTHPSLPGDIELEEFLDALNEILTSELLSVKKTLGDEHESKVAKNLKNIGKWNIKKIKS